MPARPTPPTYLEQLDSIPPRICFLTARRNRRAITQGDIMRATGWGESKVAAMCALETFADVTVADADAFRIACGVSRKDERRTRFFVRRSLGQSINSFNHLRKRGVRIPKFLRELTQNKV